MAPRAARTGGRCARTAETKKGGEVEGEFPAYLQTHRRNVMKASLQQTKRVRVPLCAFFSAMAVSGALVAMPSLAAKPIACADLKTELSISDTTITLPEMLPAGAEPNPVAPV